MRGQVDEAFINRALQEIPDGCEWLLTGLERMARGKGSWIRSCCGESLAELAVELPDFFGECVALGILPAWSENGSKQVSTVGPDADGTVTTGIY